MKNGSICCGCPLYGYWPTGVMSAENTAELDKEYRDYECEKLQKLWMYF